MQIQGTGFFYRINAVLYRAVSIQLPVSLYGDAHVEVTAEGQTFETTCVFSDGTALVPAVAVYDHPVEVNIGVTCALGSWTSQALLPAARPWTIYIAQDKHLDFGWIHPVEQVLERIHRLTDHALEQARQSNFHWNFDTSIWVEEYLKARSSQAGSELIEALRSGRFEMAAFQLVPFPGYMGTEELVHSLMPARRLEQQYGIPLHTASLQEVPTLPWGMISILAAAGIPYLVKGAYALRNPHLVEREAHPLSWWEGPDGGRVLAKWDALGNHSAWGGYAEAYPLWRAKSNQERVQFIDDTTRRFDARRYSATPDYPVDAILLAGTGFDEYPLNRVVADFIDWFNRQGWEYPKLVDATWSMFWQDVETQLAERGGSLPVTRGDLGSSWEEWPAQLAYLSVKCRRAREVVHAAQSAAACAFGLDPATHPVRSAALASAWQALIAFADHNIGGIVVPVADDMRDRKATYAYTALREGSLALESGLNVLAAGLRAPQDGSSGLLVFNPRGWQSTPLVKVMVPEVGTYAVTDLETGAEHPCCLQTAGNWPEHYLSFFAGDLPPFGYRCYAVQRVAAGRAPTEPETVTYELENTALHVRIDPLSGAVASLVERATGYEWADPGAGYGINQFLHRADGELMTAAALKVTRTCDPLAERLSVELAFPKGSLRSVYTLYRDQPFLEIENEIERAPSGEPQCSWFAFPFAAPERSYFYDSPGAILRPGLAPLGDQVPGAGMTCFAVQSFLGIQSPGGHALLATPDAHLVQFGAHILQEPIADSDPHSALVLSNVMNNFTNNDHANDQGGQARFSFRYRVGCGAGTLSPATALRFAGAFTAPAAWIHGRGQAAAPLAKSFVSVSPANVLATAFKAADDGRGWVLRLWETDGQPATAVIDARALGVAQALRCDLLERTLTPLEIQDGLVRLEIPAHGLAAIRLE
jgi:alpha-mannosidase